MRTEYSFFSTLDTFHYISLSPHIYNITWVFYSRLDKYAVMNHIRPAFSGLCNPKTITYTFVLIPSKIVIDADVDMSYLVMCIIRVCIRISKVMLLSYPVCWPCPNL